MLTFENVYCKFQRLDFLWDIVGVACVERVVCAVCIAFVVRIVFIVGFS